MENLFPFGKAEVTELDVTGRLTQIIGTTFGGFPHAEPYEDDEGKMPYITLTLANGQRFGIEVKELDRDD